MIINIIIIIIILLKQEYIKMAESKHRDQDLDQNKLTRNTKHTPTCGYCKKNVQDSVKCENCDQLFHQSCLERHKNCLKSEVMSTITNENIQSIKNENAYLKRLVKELEDKCELLMDNNKLLKHNYQLMLEKSGNCWVKHNLAPL